MKGKNVVVTGAGRGLGRLLCAHLCWQGARVAMIGRNGAALQAAALEIGEGATAYVADVADNSQVVRAFDRIAGDFGSIDVLVNNAAVMDAATVESADVAVLTAAVTINLLGTIYCSKAAIPLLRQAGGGDIVNVSSQSVASPAPTLAAYMASKAGIEAFSHGLRMELRPDNIRVGILRVGTMVWSGTQTGGDQYIELCQREGALILLNPGMEQAAAVQAIVAIVSLPRDSVAAMVELTPTVRM